MTTITGNPPWPPEQPERAAREPTILPPRVWRLHLVPGDSPTIIRARTYEDLNREVQLALERRRMAVPVEYHGAPWIRWMQRAFWGDARASSLGDWRLVEVCATCAGYGVDEYGLECRTCAGTGAPGGWRK